MGYLEFLVYFYLKNHARVVKFSYLNFTPLNLYPRRKAILKKWISYGIFLLGGGVSHDRVMMTQSITLRQICCASRVKKCVCKIEGYGHFWALFLKKLF